MTSTKLPFIALQTRTWRHILDLPSVKPEPIDPDTCKRCTSTPKSLSTFPIFAMNPFAAGGWGTGSGIAPSIFGALPSVAISNAKTTQPDSVLYKFTNCNTTILNCNIAGPQGRVVYRVVTDSGAPSSTMWKDNDNRNVAMVNWQPNANVEIRGIASRQRARDWLHLSADKSKRVMTIAGVQYAWSPIEGFICLYKLQSTAPRVLARIGRAQDVTLEMTQEAMQLGLLEACLVATVLLTCGHNVD
ncbi:uncharacterized protein B0H18DRAFT_985309 [Fomitopsis serialis]|uniref:uncharacterized protein n=1 Tax=Fomitopsis serialis TaxID=139415 RepID=UPI00200815CD|nr:uncharacterized protein B0H18DRAFT_985309 [Neoantrodia serialis]KAH9933053.1 hypothetical protein B0H18DRAFT_985309 [Neoantrodia serialis]